MGYCGSPVTQVDVESFESVEIPFEDKALKKIQPSAKSHIVIDQDITYKP